MRMRKAHGAVAHYPGRLFTFLLFCTTNAIYAESTMSDETVLIAQRLRDRLVTSAPKNVSQTARDLLDRQSSDGSWPDINYDDRSRGRWRPLSHLSRVVTLATAYHAPTQLNQDAGIRDAIRSGLQYWVDRHPVSDNWWYSVIGGPRKLGDILLLMVDELSPELADTTGKLIHRSGFTRTGANLIDEARNLLTLACAIGDVDLLREAARHISADIRVTTDEGIQADDSYHQHGPQNMIIHYGRVFSNNQARYAELFAGTAFAYSEDQIRILSRLILDGQQWYIRGRQTDYHARGRRAFQGRPGLHSWNAGGFAEMCMASADPARRDEYQAFAARVSGDQPAGSSGPLGNKHFWRSDTMVHRQIHWYESVRFHSTRTYATETRTNRENLKGYHLADGVYFLLQHGDEYHDIQPVWEYRKLPGLTFLDTNAPIPYGKETPRAGNTTFVGGVSDGRVGVSVMDYDKAGVRAKKAYFFNSNEFVCLGAGIASNQAEDVLTTLDQSRLKSEVTILRDGNPSPLKGELLEGTDIRAIHHDKVAYIVMGDATVAVRAKQQTGSWQEVEDQASNESVPQDVFTCWIDHGPKPEDATYAYRIVPNTDHSDLSDIADDNSVHVLANTPEIQAIHFADDDIIQAIFHNPGSLVLSNGKSLTTDSACVIILRPTPDNILLTVADPTQEQQQLTLTLDGHYVGTGASTTQLDPHLHG